MILQKWFLYSDLVLIIILDNCCAVFFVVVVFWWKRRYFKIKLKRTGFYLKYNWNVETQCIWIIKQNIISYMHFQEITNTHTHKHICPGEKGVKLPQSVVSSFHSNNFVNNTDFASSHFKPQITKQIASLPRGVWYFWNITTVFVLLGFGDWTTLFNQMSTAAQIHTRQRELKEK